MPKKISREQLLRKERRMICVPVNIEVVAKHLLRPQENRRLEIVEGLPPDSIFITAFYSMEYMDPFFVFAHELFEEVPESERLPIKSIVMKEVNLDDEDDE